MTNFTKFLKDEDGAVTIEWVALAAGVVLLALGVIAALDSALENTANSIAGGVQNAATSLIGQY